MHSKTIVERCIFDINYPSDLKDYTHDNEFGNALFINKLHSSFFINGLGSGGLGFRLKAVLEFLRTAFLQFIFLK